MNPPRKPLLQRLTAMLRGVCAVFTRRRPTQTPPQPTQARKPKPVPTEAVRQAREEAAMLRAFAELERLFQSWQNGTLPAHLLRRPSPRPGPRPRAPQRIETSNRSRRPAPPPRAHGAAPASAAFPPQPGGFSKFSRHPLPPDHALIVPLTKLIPKNPTSSTPPH